MAEDYSLILNIKNKVKNWLYSLDTESALLDHICFTFRNNRKFNEVAKPNIFLKQKDAEIRFNTSMIDRILCKRDCSHSNILRRIGLSSSYDHERIFLESLFSNMFTVKKYKKKISIRDINAISNSKSHLYNYATFSDFASVCTNYPLKNNDAYEKFFSSFMTSYKSGEFSLSYYPDQDIKQFCNHDGSHRFSLIHDYLTRNGIDKYLEFDVWEESINKDFLSNVQSEYKSFILPRILSKNNSVTDLNLVCYNKNPGS